MLKAGLVGAGVSLVLALVTAVITPCCNPCVAILLGLGVGVLAAMWERTATSETSAGAGAKAGAIASVGGLIGQMLGAVANGFIVGPSGVAEIYRRLDLQMPMSTQSYWAYNLGSNCLCAVVNVALGAALGAVGGLLWYQLSGKNQPAVGPFEERL